MLGTADLRSTPARGLPWPQRIAVAVAVFALAAGAVAAFVAGLAASLLLVPPLGLILLLVGRRLVPRADRSTVFILVGLGAALRVGAAPIIYVTMRALGGDGFVTGDDRNYFQIGVDLASWVSGTADAETITRTFGANSYLLNSYTYLQGLLYLIFGTNVLAPEIFNAFCSGLTALLLYDLARRLLGRAPAILTITIFALYPSVLLWSALNLKEAITLTLATSALWAITRFRERPRTRLIVALLVSLVLLEAMRRYLFDGLIILAVLGIGLAEGFAPRRRAVWVLGASIAAVLLLLTPTRAGPGVPTGFEGLEQIRQNLAFGARTSIVEHRFIGAKEGETFIVVDLVAETPPPSPMAAVLPGTPQPTPASGPPTPQRTSSSPPVTQQPASSASSPPVTQQPASSASSPPVTQQPAPGQTRPPTTSQPTSSSSALPTGPASTTRPIATRTASPSAAPAAPSVTLSPREPVTVFVKPGAVVRLEKPTSPPDASVTYVRPGDLVVVGDAGGGAGVVGGEAARRTLALSDVLAGDSATIVTPSSGNTETLAFTRTISYLPRGLAYALFSPFPWDVRRAVDLATLPEQILWYAMLIAAPVSLWRRRPAWRSIGVLVLYVGGLLLVFSLTEGNYGTLFRHRSMVIPFVTLLASPGLIELWRWLAARRRAALA